MSHERRNEPLKVILQTKSNIIEKIKENLGKILTARFWEGVFDHFMKFSTTNQSPQLLLHLIQRMCKSKSTIQLHFQIGGRVLKFGLREFALTTGPNYHEISYVNKKDIKDKWWGWLNRVYFKTLKSVRRHYLNTMFNISTTGTDDDRIRMTKLYFLESFLLPRQESLSTEWITF